MTKKKNEIIITKELAMLGNDFSVQGLKNIPAKIIDSENK